MLSGGVLKYFTFCLHSRTRNSLFKRFRFQKLCSMKNRQLVIAIDGPSGSGKSTTARKVAERLEYTYIDTGAMYRAVTLAVLRKNLDVADIPTVEEIANVVQIRFVRRSDGILSTLLDGEDVTSEIRRPEVTANVSAVSSYPGVRDALVAHQRSMGNEGGVVLDGRDIGTVVFPDADLKIFMVADIQSRARRRQLELASLGQDVTVKDVAIDLERRDRLDSERDISPLRKADDAVEIDTSGLTIERQVENVLALVNDIQRSRSNIHV